MCSWEGDKGFGCLAAGKSLILVFEPGNEKTKGFMSERSEIFSNMYMTGIGDSNSLLGKSWGNYGGQELGQIGHIGVSRWWQS